MRGVLGKSETEDSTLWIVSKTPSLSNRAFAPVGFLGGKQKKGFTLLEVLVGMVVLAVLVLLCANIISSASTAWKRADQKTTAFQSARLVFESITLALSQATLNPYWDYVDSNGKRRAGLTQAQLDVYKPVGYDRSSDLHFLITPAPTPPPAASPPPFAGLPNTPGGTDACFFQVPSGYSSDPTLRSLGNLLNSVGFFIQFGSDQAWRPSFITPAITPYKYRYRLMQLLEPAANNHVYSSYDPANERLTRWKWISDALAANPSVVYPIADNIISLILVPRDPENTALSANYLYDSRDKNTPAAYNQLPPFVEVIMVAIDEPSANRLANGSIPPQIPPNFDKSLLFKDVNNLESDLASLESALQIGGIDYRIFRTTVRIESSRWSK